MNSGHAAHPAGVSLAGLSTQARTAMCEVEVVKRLLARDCREGWTRAALECVVAGSPLDVSDALSNLAAARVIHLTEGRVALSRTARDLICATAICGATSGRAVWGESVPAQARPAPGLTLSPRGDQETKDRGVASPRWHSKVVERFSGLSSTA